MRQCRAGFCERREDSCLCMRGKPVVRSTPPALEAGPFKGLPPTFRERSERTYAGTLYWFVQDGKAVAAMPASTLTPLEKYLFPAMSKQHFSEKGANLHNLPGNCTHTTISSSNVREVHDEVGEVCGPLGKILANLGLPSIFPIFSEMLA